MVKHDIESMMEQGVPKLPTNMNTKNAVEYVGLVYSGVDKVEAFRQVFPDKCKKIEDKAQKDRRDKVATLRYHIGIYERGKYVSSLYEVGAKNYFVEFVDKKTNLLNEVYDVAMDKEENMRNRLNASKIFLSSIPEAPKEVTVKHEVDVKNDFNKKLEERQRALYSIANNETDILDAEIDE